MHCTGGAQRVAPCVVGVGHDARAAGADKAGHIALCVLDVEVLRAVDSFRDALAAGIVAVGDIRPRLAHPSELTPVLPCIGPRAVAFVPPVNNAGFK